MKCFPLHVRQIQQRRRNVFYMLLNGESPEKDPAQPEPGHVVHFSPPDDHAHRQGNGPDSDNVADEEDPRGNDDRPA